MPGWIRTRIAAGEALGCLWLSLGSSAIAEIAAEAAPDAIVFDQQHGLWDRLTRETAIGLVRHRTSPLVRVARNDAGPLCASKAAALSLTQATRAHLRARNTRVLAVLPGAVDTDMSRGLDASKMSPESVADAVIDGLARGLEEIYPGDMAAGVAFGRVMDAKAVEHQFAGYHNPAETW